LTEIAAELDDSEALEKARTTAQASEENLREVQATMRNLDLEVKGLADKIANQEKLLYSGKGLSAKEAANLQDEIESLKRWHSKREEVLLEAMVGAEEAEEVRDKAQTELSDVEADWTDNQARLKQSQDTLNSKLAELNEQRPTLARTINGDDLNEYEHLRSKRAGVAIAAVKDGVCQRCGMTASNNKIQRARVGAELTYCSTCGRILYVP
jgi:predicted  nucleic acid-binding Zn-ribbon protein